MSKRERSKIQVIYQTLLDVDHPPIQVASYHENDLNDESFEALLGQSVAAIGISAAYAPRSRALSSIALCVGERAMLIQLSSAGSRSARRSSGMDGDVATSILEKRVLRNASGGWAVFGIDIDQIALGLYKDHGISMDNGVDIQSVCPMKGARSPLTTVKYCLGDEVDIHRENIIQAFLDMTSDAKSTLDIVQRAWLSWFLPVHPQMEEKFREIPRINISSFTSEVLTWLAMAMRDTQLEEESGRTVHEYRGARMIKQGKLQVRQDRFQSRIQKFGGNQQQLDLLISTPEGSYALAARPARVWGRNAEISLSSDLVLEGKSIQSMVTTGPGQPTQAEALRASTILDILQKKIQPFDNPWLKCLYLGHQPVWPENPNAHASPSLNPIRPLNNSQIIAASQMLSSLEEHRITIIQGPPGTGKTSVIGQFVLSAISGGLRGIWLAAKSNVAVKNIAEKLYSLGFTAWRLLVSAEFHNDWHEHLYAGLTANVIRSDELPRMSPNSVNQRFNGCQVVLCTLDMLSNPQLQHRGIIHLIPITTLVIDEASQIDVNSYIPVLQNFGTSLQKMCFIGDNKQLPPYGQESNEDLKSIFELSHLSQEPVFLKVQYRMPPSLGSFISQHVYEGKLQSNPEHPVTKSTCFFIDVDRAEEKAKDTSWMNPMECQVAAFIARHLEERKLNYRVITPYDAQRSVLETHFKEHGLTWKDKCFNVDSFQGNEDDYIILSLVRTRDIGFLQDLRRTNVMLTRCRRGMFICTSRAFMEGAGATTLVGQMVAELGEDAWLTREDFEDYHF